MKTYTERIKQINEAKNDILFETEEKKPSKWKVLYGSDLKTDKVLNDDADIFKLAKPIFKKSFMKGNIPNNDRAFCTLVDNIVIANGKHMHSNWRDNAKSYYNKFRKTAYESINTETESEKLNEDRYTNIMETERMWKNWFKDSVKVTPKKVTYNDDDKSITITIDTGFVISASDINDILKKRKCHDMLIHYSSGEITIKILE